jgi:hypothetical protein
MEMNNRKERAFPEVFSPTIRLPEARFMYILQNSSGSFAAARFHPPFDKEDRMESTETYEAPRKETWKKIIDHPDLEIYWPSRTTVVGFLVAWLFVILIIAGAMFIARIGA